MQQNPLILNGRFLRPDNKLVKFNNLEDIPSLLFEIGIDIEKPICYVIDRGYGDIIGRTNYWLWLNELHPLSLKFIVVKDHYDLWLDDVETTVQRAQLLLEEYGFDRLTFVTETDKVFAKLKQSKHWANSGNYFFINLFNKQQHWYPFKKTWTGKFSKYVAYYDYIYFDWERVLLTWKTNQDKVNGISDEEKYKNFVSMIINNLSMNYEVKKINYKLTTKDTIQMIRGANFTVCNRGAALFIASALQAPKCLTIKQKYLEWDRYYCNFTKKIVISDDPNYIGKLKNQHEDFILMPKHKYIKEGFLPKEI